MTKIFYGTAALVMCCVFYLIWWVLAFRPAGKVGVTWPWLIFAAVFGFAGVIVSVGGINTDVPGHKMLGIWPLIVGICVYFALLFITSHFMHRMVTTELVLIVGWTALQFMVLDTAQCLASSGGISRQTAVAFMVLALIVAVLSLIAYLSYYKLPVVKGYIAGMLPLIMIGVLMAVELVCFRPAK